MIVLDRRRLLLTAVPALVPASLQAQEEPKRPDPADFQAGDFLWPRRPGQWVPYVSGASAERDVDKKRWLRERDRFVVAVRSDPASSPARRQLATDLEGLEYAEFYELYQGDQAPSNHQPFGGGGGGFYVGHVAIVSFEAGRPWVIEALDDRNVVKSPYDQWLAGRPGAWIWQGRIANHTPADRARIADAAHRYLGVRYDFWNLDLSNESGFYCSKLCWLATLKAVEQPIDGNAEPNRTFWFSPKQMLKARSIEKRFNPGNYTF